jgi:sterol desaturase/sphingolipid hydroxylase (fatty acid hydroxylase superfamily)
MGGFHAVSDTLGYALAELFLSATSRTYLPFLVTGLILSLYGMWREKDAHLAPHQRVLSRETWLSRSAVNDYGLIFGNALLVAFLLTPLFPDVSGILSMVKASVTNALPPVASGNSVGVGILFALSLFVVDDFVRYAVHYCEHRIPVLWELHKVHHSAEVLNFMTAERHHPLSLLVFGCVSALGVVGVNTLFILMFHGSVSMTTLLGGNLFWILANLIGGALRHSPVWISFGPHVERWLISPAQHQIHHSADVKHFDRNFGGSLAIWDRMFGTLYLTAQAREPIQFGLGAETRCYGSLIALYAVPMAGIARIMGKNQVATTL